MSPSHSDARFGRCPTCGGTTENEPYSCSNCIAAIPDPGAEIRDEAVRRVDGRYGYTAEHAPDPAAHRDEYDREEEELLLAGSEDYDPEFGFGGPAGVLSDRDADPGAYA